MKSESPERVKAFAKFLGYSEVTFVEHAIQDMLTKSGIKARVHLEAA